MPDASTPTGKRLNIALESAPANLLGVHIDTTDINRGDGFSPGNLITLKVPEVDTPAAFENSGLVPIDDQRRYDDLDQSVIVIDAATGERQPVWAELDSNPTAVDPGESGSGGINPNPDNNEPVNLIVRPAKNFEFGHRYIVAFRDLRNADDEPVESPIRFRVYRDDAFAQPGDRKIQGDSPQVVVTGTCDAEPVSSLPQPGCEVQVKRVPGLPILAPPGQPDGGQVVRYVDGYLTVPCYLDQPLCPPGSKFAFDANDEIAPLPGNTMPVPFRCAIPRSTQTGTINGSAVDAAEPGIYGHGLLGSLDQINAANAVGNQGNSIWCATNFDGFSSYDLPFVLASLADMSNFNKLADRMQQGFVNFMMLGRAMLHEDGFAAQDAFKLDVDSDPLTDNKESVIDTSEFPDNRLKYLGISQGGIMGGALMALEPDADRGVLGVPGMNYSTLLRRSVDSDQYFKLPAVGLYANYPSEIERPLLLSLIQLLWDRGEANGYAHNMTTDPLPDTPPHEVLLQPALGDHQVANVSVEVEARTIGASVYSPGLHPGRHWESDPFFGINEVSSFPYDAGSMLVYYDGGPVGFIGTRGGGTAVSPNENVSLREEWGYGNDPHSYPRASTDGITQGVEFLRDGTVVPCAAGGYCYSNGWTGP